MSLNLIRQAAELEYCLNEENEEVENFHQFLTQTPGGVPKYKPPRVKKPRSFMDSVGLRLRSGLERVGVTPHSIRAATRTSPMARMAVQGGLRLRRFAKQNKTGLIAGGAVGLGAYAGARLAGMTGRRRYDDY